MWECTIPGPAHEFPQRANSMLDTGNPTVLIDNEYATHLGLKRKKLPHPEVFDVAMKNIEEKEKLVLHEYVKFKVSDPTNSWESKHVHAIVAPQLCVPVILGMTFLGENNIVIDVGACTAIDKTTGFDLMNPIPASPLPPPRPRLREVFRKIKSDRAEVVKELKSELAKRGQTAPIAFKVNVVGAIRERIEVLVAQEHLKQHGEDLKAEFHDVFEPIPHADELLSDVYCRIKLKDSTKMIASRSYSCPRKYKEAWSVLIQQHLDAGRIRPSNSQHASPAFLVPKSNPTAMPRWVNDYCQLNTNTVPDSHPLPRVDDILAECARGKIWSVLDMTNSFFQTRVHPDDVPFTAVTTPMGLYEWLVMPMGLRNAPPIHQRRMTAALRPFLGRFCHIYIDDIVIWSDSVDEHEKHIRTILQALRKAKLFCNPKKCDFFLLELDFLRHHISSRGIEANSLKVDQILQWPTPTSATDVRSFLGLVRYLATFLPKLADHTTVLTPLTMKEAKNFFPPWTDAHQAAFQAIKDLVMSCECLTVIDHDNLGENNIYVTCDASDWRTGTTLSFGKTWESAWPVAFDSMQLKSTELNYPVHEKELLAIICALKKWRTDLLGNHFYVYTDHRTLENFDMQWDLSRRQLRWQEFISQYDMDLLYIRGEDNCVADTLSRLPSGSFPDERGTTEEPFHTTWGQFNTVGAMLTITTDAKLLEAIRKGYLTDSFCKKITASHSNTPGITMANGLLYAGSRLIIPTVQDIRENLFRLAHDCLGHFGADKSYAALKDAYYWPNMRRDLEQAYVPGCVDCQHNKWQTKKPAGPLHPLPVPDDRCESVAMDFIGPLPVDDGFDCILTVTDHLNSDLRVILTHTDITHCTQP
jgi:hypothetical protein